MRTLISMLSQLLFAPRCVGCDKDTVVWCAVCALEPAWPYANKSITTPFRYNTEKIKKAIRYLKRHHSVTLADWFADHMINSWHDNLVENWYFAPAMHHKIIITYIPPHHGKTYCCAKLLATCLSNKLNYPHALKNTLRFTRRTTKQALLNKINRAKNLHHALQASHHVAGKHVIVIDDITTTGATLIEAKRALTAANAAHVWCLAAVHTAIKS